MQLTPMLASGYRRHHSRIREGSVDASKVAPTAADDRDFAAQRQYRPAQPLGVGQRG